MYLYNSNLLAIYLADGFDTVDCATCCVGVGVIGNLSVFFLSQVANVFSLGLSCFDCSRCV